MPETSKLLVWLVGVLLLANILAFVTMRGLFGPSPAAGPREPNHLNRQVRPDQLRVTPVSSGDAADLAVVGGPAPVAPIAASAISQ